MLPVLRGAQSLGERLLQRAVAALLGFRALLTPPLALTLCDAGLFSSRPVDVCASATVPHMLAPQTKLRRAAGARFVRRLAQCAMLIPGRGTGVPAVIEPVSTSRVRAHFAVGVPYTSAGSFAPANRAPETGRRAKRGGVRLSVGLAVQHSQGFVSLFSSGHARHCH